MNTNRSKLNPMVSDFIDALDHPLKEAIELLRVILLDADIALTENIKWNGPNYALNNQDRITMKIQPPTKIQLIFHRGAKVQAQPLNRLIDDETGLLSWKENDRAIATFKDVTAIEETKNHLTKIVQDWLKAAS